MSRESFPIFDSYMLSTMSLDELNKEITEAIHEILDEERAGIIAAIHRIAETGSRQQYADYNFWDGLGVVEKIIRERSSDSK
jgi:hypothetical protein